MRDALRLSLGGWKDDSINKPDIHRKRGGLLGGVLAHQETGLTGPLSIYKVVPKVSKYTYITVPLIRIMAMIIKAFLNKLSF